MKNKKIMIALLTLLTYTSHAQVSDELKKKYSKFEVVTFQIEDENYVFSNGLKPNTTTEYYSRPEGGRCVKSIISKEDGSLVSKFDIKEDVGMILNNAKVSYTLEKEFVLKNILVQNERTNVTISCKALANEDEIELNILKSIDGKNFKAIKSFSIPKQQSLSSINFQDEYNNVAVYKLEVVKSKTKQRYISSEYNFNNKSEIFDVFPTISKEEVHVNFQTIDNPVEYQIVNSQGQMQLKGVFDKNFNSINISQFANGIYYVVLNIDNQLFTTKINKQ